MILKSKKVSQKPAKVSCFKHENVASYCDKNLCKKLWQSHGFSDLLICWIPWEPVDIKGSRGNYSILTGTVSKNSLFTVYIHCT